MPRHRTPPTATEVSSPDDILTPDQVADILHVTRRMVRKMWQDRELGGVKVGRLVRHRRSDIDAYIETRIIEPAKRETRSASHPAATIPPRKRKGNHLRLLP